jgi:hypothetical protein
MLCAKEEVDMANNQEKQQEENNTITIKFFRYPLTIEGSCISLYYAPIVVMSMKHHGNNNKPDLTSFLSAQIYLVLS